MNTLSLFNGMSFCSMALESLGIKVNKYYSSEIDKYANQATDAMFGKPLTFIEWCKEFHLGDVDNDCEVINTSELEYIHGDNYDANYLLPFLESKPVHLGDILNWRDWDIDWASIDLVTGGFPCQAWSMAGKQLGDKDERGMLFWTMLDIMKHVKYHNPKADFLIENVKMKKEFEQYITTHTENALGKVHKILINSALVSAQNRNRYYWTSFLVTQPGDKGILLKDIIEYECLDTNSDGWHKWWMDKQEFQVKKKYSAICNDGSTDKAICMTARQYASWNGNFLIIQKPRGNNPGGERATDGKTPCLSANSWEHNNHLMMKSAAERGRGFEVRKDDKANCLLSDGHQSRWLANDGAKYRKLTPRECFRLQTVPEHHIDTLLSAGISNTQLYKMCGNGWTMEVIKHILKSSNLIKD